ncbi:MAG TPA: zinc ABC transporter substrate-binding protein [Acetobacteraceae bacterium]|nr:zinc ABC transporter substrate-binding protein [Acetobacteraceae bacterium]
MARVLGVIAAAATALLAATAAVRAVPPALSIVAAENMYGDVAQQIAGPDSRVTSILSNPDADPHLFEASPSVARSLAGARIVIVNGADYDPWMQKLLAVGAAPGRQVIVVADLVHRKPGGNPHLWYDPATMPAVARALAAALTAADPAHRAEYAARLQRFTASLAPLDATVAQLRRRYAGTAVAATEPVFGYMASALGLAMHEQRFQIAVMNDTEPSARDTAAFERDLHEHRVRVLFYNSQASDPAAARLLHIARSAGVPVVGVTETEPNGVDYQHWMLGTLDALDHALSQHGA